MRTPWLIAVLAAVLAAASPAAAKSYREIPLPEFLAAHGPVFVGKLSRIDRAKVEDRPVFLATIDVAETLRGNLPTSVQISWPDLGPGKGYAGMTYDVGAEGIWILRGRSQLIGDGPTAGRLAALRREHPHLYAADHPACLQPLAKKEEVLRILALLSLRLRLDLSSYDGVPRPGEAPSRAVRLWIDNPGRAALKLAHLENRQALTFIILDDLGNVVAPAPRGKVDPAAFDDVELPAGEHLLHQRTGLDFVTGSAGFGYDLEPGRTYRVTAIYRPGPDLPSVASAEVSLTAR